MEETIKTSQASLSAWNAHPKKIANTVSREVVFVVDLLMKG